MERSKWFLRNSFDNNQSYAEKLLSFYEIEKYHFVTGSYGCTSLLIVHRLKTYRIEVNEESCEMVIRKKIITRKGQKHTKEHFIVACKPFKVDCINQSIKWIKNNSGI